MIAAATIFSSAAPCMPSAFLLSTMKGKSGKVDHACEFQNDNLRCLEKPNFSPTLPGIVECAVEQTQTACISKKQFFCSFLRTQNRAKQVNGSCERVYFFAWNGVNVIGVEVFCEIIFVPIYSTDQALQMLGSFPQKGI